MVEDPGFRVLSGYKWWRTRYLEYNFSTSPNFGVESQARSRNFTSTTRRVTSIGSTRQSQFKQTDVSKASSPGSQLNLAMRKSSVATGSKLLLAMPKSTNISQHDVVFRFGSSSSQSWSHRRKVRSSSSPRKNSQHDLNGSAVHPSKAGRIDARFAVHPRPEKTRSTLQLTHLVLPSRPRVNHSKRSLEQSKA